MLDIEVDSASQLPEELRKERKTSGNYSKS
jgi:hypothetical protein